MIAIPEWLGTICVLFLLVEDCIEGRLSTSEKLLEERVKSGISLIYFGASSWCHNTWVMDPKWLEVSQHAKKYENLGIHLGKFDCSELDDYCRNVWRVDGYPTLNLYDNGSFIQEYPDADEVVSLNAYIDRIAQTILGKNSKKVSAALEPAKVSAPPPVQGNPVPSTSTQPLKQPQGHVVTNPNANADSGPNLESANGHTILKHKELQQVVKDVHKVSVRKSIDTVIDSQGPSSLDILLILIPVLIVLFILGYIWFKRYMQASTPDYKRV